ncbi:MAG TPA: exopolysaccharide biosynthesis polyprenyl glycosylphosphotransferase [Caulobacteraceae bacterium]|nr:exopolysaccharide biosynthesis polyprenyl glycosylphosphotransferase [Caulobacteraceae bacterium]
MPLAAARARDPSHPETPAASEPPELLLDETMRLPPAEQPRDRRGPMRPASLTPARSRLTGWMLGAIFRIGDAIALASISAAAAPMAAGRLSPASLTPFVVGSLALLWALQAIHAYAFYQREGLGRHLVRVAAGFGLASLALEFLLIGFHPASMPEQPLELWFAASFLALYVLHAAWWALVRGWRAAGRLTPNIVVVGANQNAEALVGAAMRSGEAAVLGVFDDRVGRTGRDVAGVPVLGDTGALIGHRIMPYVDRVVITVPQNAQARVRQLIDQLSVLPNEIMLFIDQGPAGRAAALSRIADAPLAPVSGAPSNERRALVKRAQDLVIGSLALALGLPVMLLIALAIKLDSPGPVFFRQRRHGFNNEEILVWKFRSMRPTSDPGAGVRQVALGDDRVTRVGRIIRRTSLDELPQLINVLRGEMSLVGPRPHAVGMKTGQTESAKLVAQYAHRHRMKPGMTGWAAIKGSRGPVDTPELVRRRVALDIEYIERQSLMFDLIIMAQTLPCLLGDTETVR